MNFTWITLKSIKSVEWIKLSLLGRSGGWLKGAMALGVHNGKSCPAVMSPTQSVTFGSSWLPQNWGCLWSIYFLLGRCEEAESHIFHDLFLLWTLADFFLSLWNDTLFQVCKFGIFGVSSRKKWAVILWKVESLPFLGHVSRTEKSDRKGYTRKKESRKWTRNRMG